LKKYSPLLFIHNLHWSYSSFEKTAFHINLLHHLHLYFPLLAVSDAEVAIYIILTHFASISTPIALTQF